jgi:carbon storage regulator
MLVLSRKRGEQIVIGPNIELTVVDIRGNKVLLAVDAPREVTIHRQAVYRRIQDEGRKAVMGNRCTGAGVDDNSSVRDVDPIHLELDSRCGSPGGG